MFQDEGSSSVTSSPLEFFSMMTTLSPTLGSPHPWRRELRSEDRGLYLIKFLLACTTHISANNLENANFFLEEISHLASPDGDTMQRIAAYFAEALADRILKTWKGIHKALNSTRISLVSEEIYVRKLFFEIFPFLKVAYVLANQSIIEAMEGENHIHIIDLNASEPAQWIALLEAFSARPEGSPNLRITGVHRNKEVLDQIGHILTKKAEQLDYSFQFKSVVTNLENLDVEKLGVKSGEALAISSVLQMHTLLGYEDESPLLLRKMSKGSCPSGLAVNFPMGLNKRTLGEFQSPSPDSTTSASPSFGKIDSFLNALWGLSPKVMIITEQDSNHNGSSLMDRLSEALFFYAAMFDGLESTMSRTSLERLKVEKMLLGEEIKNILACEGGERKERHEKFEKWIRRLDSSGFGNVGLSYYGMLQAHRLLQGYGCDGYKIREDNGGVLLCWQDRPLFSVSAWRCRKLG